ncbi:MAG TPA: ATP-binding protein [Acetobacteraceae bacterium]|nr:ATP-binding protein [Acetobacteraceae bacterium]
MRDTSPLSFVHGYMLAIGIIGTVVSRTRALPTWAKYLATSGVVAALVPPSVALQGVLPPGYPFLPFFFGILMAGSLFDHGSGFFATALSALFAAVFFLPPTGGSGPFAEAPQGGVLAPLLLFAAVGASIAMVVEVLHSALLRERRARAELARSEEQRRLLLNEFRHRTRNDLQSLAALLLLRARAAPSPAAADGLREAAEHARAVARVHAWLAQGDASRADGAGGDPAHVDTKDFVEGFCRDLDRAWSGGELRPVALIAEAESHSLDTERAVHLGLVLNELVTNALKYAFPDNAAGTVRVAFHRDGRSFLLSVADNGVGLPADDPPAAAAATGTRPLGTGLGTRLLQVLAAQLRGTLSRRSGENGSGTLAELRFPVAAPGR